MAKQLQDDRTDSTPNPVPISAFVITYNEEDDIAACLESLSFCDEVLVIDSFSTDRTPEICREFGARLIQREWPGFRAQKAFGLSEASSPWVLNLDADERVDAELRKNIIQILTQDAEGKSSYAGYEVNRVVFYLGRWWRKGGWYPEYRLRLLRKEKASWGGVDPHEKALVDGRVARLEGELQHYTYKRMDEQFAQLHRFSSILAAQEFERGERSSLRRLLLNPILRMLKFYIVKRGYREGVAGLIVAIAEGYYTFAKYAKLWELEFIQRSAQKNSDSSSSSSSPSVSSAKAANDRR